MTFLQRELDFSAYETTEQDLIEAWARPDREIRSHRRVPRFSRLQITVALVTFAVTLGLVGAPPSAQPDGAAPLAAPAPPADIQTLTAEATDTTANLWPRGGPRVSRRLDRNAESQTMRWTTPLANFRITSCFGPRWGRIHKGVDMAAPRNAPIRSVGAGVVVQAGWHFSGYGYSVVVDHGDWLTLYGHARRVLVKIGQRVGAGTKIALVGATGAASGNHLHLGVSHSPTLRGMWDRFVDPTRWLTAQGVSGLSGCG